MLKVSSFLSGDSMKFLIDMQLQVNDIIIIERV